MDTMQVARTILEQLGGNKFVVMTGARNLVGSENSLSMRIGRNSTRINALRITLDASDTYTMTFSRVRRTKAGLSNDTIKELSGVYCDQLRTIFTDTTGLYTSLGG